MAMACRGSAVCAWRSAPGAPQTARAMSKTLPAAARLRRRRGRMRGTQRGKLTAAMRLGDFGKYFHQIGQAGAAWLGFEASRGRYRDLSYHNAAALWLYRTVE